MIFESTAWASNFALLIMLVVSLGWVAPQRAPSREAFVTTMDVWYIRLRSSIPSIMRMSTGTTRANSMIACPCSLAVRLRKWRWIRPDIFLSCNTDGPSIPMTPIAQISASFQAKRSA